MKCHSIGFHINHIAQKYPLIRWDFLLRRELYWTSIINAQRSLTKVKDARMVDTDTQGAQRAYRPFHGGHDHPWETISRRDNAALTGCVIPMNRASSCRTSLSDTEGRRIEEGKRQHKDAIIHVC
jgi:hypothetical protein